MRKDGRRDNQLRPLKFEMGYLKHHKSSVMVSAGDTKILVVVTSEDRVPPHRFNVGGWLSAEYNMLPGATQQRKPRAISKLRNDGRSVEISRLIGRAMRQAVDIDALGQRTLLIDCDVIEADAGTRCAAITGAYMAVCAHVAEIIKSGQMRMTTMEDIIKRPVAAVSLGVISERVLLDITYEEDIKADIDCNLVGTLSGSLVELQCSAERKPLAKNLLDNVLDLGQKALNDIIVLQKRELLRQCGLILHHE
jgi:ribonuclease PH